MNQAEDFYEILQVHPNAHPDVIRAAFRRLTLLYHPDRNPSTEAAEMMKRLNLAYETLSDPDRRAAYDRTRGTQQRQRTEHRSHDTDSERPRRSRAASGSTSQSRTATPAAPPQSRWVNAPRIIAGAVGLAVVGAIVVAAVFAFGGRGDGDDGGSRSVAFLPTSTLIPVTATPVPEPSKIPASGAAAGVAPTATATLGPTPTQAPAPVREATPADTAQPTAPRVPPATARPTPTSAPTPVPPTLTTTPRPTPMFTPKPINFLLITIIEGNGNRTTLPFSVTTDTWILELPSQGGLWVGVLNERNSQVESIGPDWGGDVLVYNATGSFHLDVRPNDSYGNRPWSLKVKVP